jgi:hypothetical protein
LIRPSDLAFLALSCSVALVVGLVAPRDHRSRVWVLVLPLAAAVTAVADRALGGALPHGARIPGVHLGVGVVLAIAVGVAGLRLGRLRDPLPVVGLLLVVLVCLWLGTPETSYVLLVAGTLAGVAASALLAGRVMSRGVFGGSCAAAALALALGAGSEVRPLVGGALCLLPVLWIGLRQRVKVDKTSLLAAATVGAAAARGVAVQPSWTAGFPWLAAIAIGMLGMAVKDLRR